MTSYSFSYNTHISGWLGGEAKGLSIKRSQVWLPVGSISSNDSRHVVDTHVLLTPSNIIWYWQRAVELCSWEGNHWEDNRRSGVTPAMCHRLSDLSSYGLNGLEREMSTPTTLERATAPLTYYLTYVSTVDKVENLRQDLKLSKADNSSIPNTAFVH